MEVNVKILDGCVSISENDPLFLLWSSINKIHEHLVSDNIFAMCTLKRLYGIYGPFSKIDVDIWYNPPKITILLNSKI